MLPCRPLQIAIEIGNLPNFRTLAICVIATVFAIVAGCASGPGNTAGQREAHKNLDKGHCPDYIIFPGDRAGYARQRYGITDAEIPSFRDRELANCEQRLKAGDTAAMHVLVEYWYVQKNSRLVARTYKTYVENGSDREELAKASVALSKLYATGERGLPIDSGAAYHYLGLAVEYGGRKYELPYANAAYSRGLYADANATYQAILGNDRRAAELEQEDICEINLKVADMHFRGRGVRENWYIAYYYWLEGLSLAGDPRWGACRRDSFVYRDRYPAEAERKKAVDRRLALLGPSELARVRSAWEAQDKMGLAYVEKLKFRRPAVTIKDDPVLRPGRSTVDAAPVKTAPLNLPPWRPLSGSVCQMRPNQGGLRWSELFQLRSGAIWTVNAGAKSTQAVGSAVAVSPNELFTNCHLITESTTVKLLQSGRSLQARVVAADQEGDRCILQTSEPLYPYVASARHYQSLMVGEEVAAIGNPKGLAASLSRGIVAQKRDRNGHAYIQTDAAISSGSSGGGLFDAAGNLVGITTFKVASGESLNFAIAVDEFCRL